MECIKAYNRFSKRKIERSFQFKNKAGYYNKNKLDNNFDLLIYLIIILF